ncbi:unnamed protein product [Rangifer tarandus platyrhynchus]|uniref:Uncharacterized protein n=1 Tax=Rangifer tarandus platyrhynchus TaxID=3082113 RepID=A0ABN8ZXV2_RANTA|nr:unnamed protein product [Rangifer tarandus platyrhynchus]
MLVHGRCEGKLAKPCGRAMRDQLKDRHACSPFASAIQLPESSLKIHLQQHEIDTHKLCRFSALLSFSGVPGSGPGWMALLPTLGRPLLALKCIARLSDPTSRVAETALRDLAQVPEVSTVQVELSIPFGF